MECGSEWPHFSTLDFVTKVMVQVVDHSLHEAGCYRHIHTSSLAPGLDSAATCYEVFGVRQGSKSTYTSSKEAQELKIVLASRMAPIDHLEVDPIYCAYDMGVISSGPRQNGVGSTSTICRNRVEASSCLHPCRRCVYC